MCCNCQLIDNIFKLIEIFLNVRAGGEIWYRVPLAI